MASSITTIGGQHRDEERVQQVEAHAAVEHGGVASRVGVKKNWGGKDAACPSVLKLVMIIHSTGKKKRKTSTQVSRVTRYPTTFRSGELAAAAALGAGRLGGRGSGGLDGGGHQRASSVKILNMVRSAMVAMHDGDDHGDHAVRGGLADLLADEGSLVEQVGDGLGVAGALGHDVDRVEDLDHEDGAEQDGHLGVGPQVRQGHEAEGLEALAPSTSAASRISPAWDCSPASRINIMNGVYCQVRVNTIVSAG